MQKRVSVKPSVTAAAEEALTTTCGLCGRLETKGNRCRTPRAIAYGDLYRGLRKSFVALYRPQCRDNDHKVPAVGSSRAASVTVSRTPSPIPSQKTLICMDYHASAGVAASLSRTSGSARVDFRWGVLQSLLTPPHICVSEHTVSLPLQRGDACRPTATVRCHINSAISVAGCAGDVCVVCRVVVGVGSGAEASCGTRSPATQSPS